jgi:hypothetical protein
MGTEVTARGVASVPGSAGGVRSLPASPGGVRSSGGSPAGAVATVIVAVADSRVAGSSGAAIISATGVKAPEATTRFEALASVVEASRRSRPEFQASLLCAGVDAAIAEVTPATSAEAVVAWLVGAGPSPLGDAIAVVSTLVAASIADVWPPMSRNVSPYATPIVATSPTPVVIIPTRQLRRCDIRRM